MNSSLWWIWMIVAAFFVIAEIFTAGFFLLWFGVGAAVAGLAALAGTGPAWQLAAFVVVSFVLLVVSRRFADRVSNEQPPGIGADRFIGETCVVLERIDNEANTGRVRMGKEEWRAESADENTVEAGARVTVDRVVGTHLVVGPIEKGD